MSDIYHNYEKNLIMAVNNNCIFVSFAAIDCGFLTDPDNGSVEEAGTLLGSTATYRCSQGFQLIGEDMRYCQANGLWAGNEPFCQGMV